MPLKSNMTNLAPASQQYRRSVQLLSRGYSNRKAFPGGTITVFPWDSETDDWLTQRVKSGIKETILFDLCGQLCDLNGCALNDFVAGDVTTILMVARSIARDNFLTFTTVCPQCGNSSQEKVIVPDGLERVGEKGLDYPGFDTVTLDKCKDIVKTKPLLIKDECTIANRSDDSKSRYPDRIAHIIASVISVNDTMADSVEELATWFRALHPYDASYLEEQINRNTPHLGTDFQCKCDKCGKQFTHLIQLDQEFFRSGLRTLKA